MVLASPDLKVQVILGIWSHLSSFKLDDVAQVILDAHSLEAVLPVNVERK